MKKIVVLYGTENTFPWALVDRIDSMDPEGVCAERRETGAFRVDRGSLRFRPFLRCMRSSPCWPRATLTPTSCPAACATCSRGST